VTGPGSPPGDLRLTPDVWAALRDARPVVALESSVIAQGLPPPANREAVARMQSAIARQGAVPAITAVVDGVPTLGITDEELEHFLAREGVRKVSARDLGVTAAAGASGATTVSGTLAIMARSDVRVFATGGIGGVHREPAFDESADLVELARTPAIVVCAGAKSILDLPATMERLETLAIPVIGFQTKEFPAFFTATSGLPLTAVADSVETIVRIEQAHRGLGRREALLVVQPPPADVALGAEELDQAIRESLAEARAAGIRGPATTPFLLAAVERRTEGRSLRANVALLEANAALAARIAVALR
jgi:pseudouridine-5'-phosphate glycosidase